MIENSSYAVLGLSKGASEKDIKAAYVNLVKKYDPEKHTDRFMVIQQAYDRLRQTKTRAREDIKSFNMVRGEYLFQENEKWQDPNPPEETFIAKMRAEYLENPLDDKRKLQFCRTLFARAHYLVTRKQLSDAIRDWSEVLEHDPSHARARHNVELACNNLGISYALHGLHEEAVELLERALKLNPDNNETIHNLALLAEKARDPERVRRYWEAAISRWKGELDRDPENDYLRQLITEALSHQDDIAELLHAAPRRDTRSSESVSLPSRETTAPRPATAMPSSDSVPRLENGPSPGSSAAASGSLDRMREIAKLNPDDFDAQYQLCNKLMEERLWAEADKELEELARKHPKNTEVLNLRGWALLNNQQKDAAFACWNRSMSLDPKNPSTREQLVRAHLMMGNAFRKKGIFTQALVHYKKLLQLEPNSAEVHLEIAATYDMKGDVRSAAQEYTRVMQLDPKNKVAKKALNDLRLKR